MSGALFLCQEVWPEGGIRVVDLFVASDHIKITIFSGRPITNWLLVVHMRALANTATSVHGEIFVCSYDTSRHTLH